MCIRVQLRVRLSAMRCHSRSELIWKQLTNDEQQWTELQNHSCKQNKSTYNLQLLSKQPFKCPQEFRFLMLNATKNTLGTVPIVYLLIFRLLLRNSETRLISMDASPGRRKELLPAHGKGVWLDPRIRSSGSRWRACDERAMPCCAHHTACSFVCSCLYLELWQEGFLLFRSCNAGVLSSLGRWHLNLTCKGRSAPLNKDSFLLLLVYTTSPFSSPLMWWTLELEYLIHKIQILFFIKCVSLLAVTTCLANMTSCMWWYWRCEVQI